MIKTMYLCCSIREKPNDSELEKILKKIEDSISRLYFLFFLFLDNFGKINEYLDIKKFLIITDLGEATFCIDKTANLL